MRFITQFFLMASLAVISFSMGSKTHDLVYAKTYTYEDVKPIFKKRCAMCHHPGFVGSNWQKYEDAYKKRDKIKFRLKNRTMPPGNATGLTDEERDQILLWIDQGAKK